MLMDFPCSSAAAAGFQKMVDASAQGDPVTANPREVAQVPTSLSPNPWAEAMEAGRQAAAMAIHRRREDKGAEILILDSLENVLFLRTPLWADCAAPSRMHFSNTIRCPFSCAGMLLLVSCDRGLD
jgi:hypothetical protein